MTSRHDDSRSLLALGSTAALVLVLLLLLGPTANVAHAQSLGAWNATTNYPSQLAAMGCATVSDEVYCVGGFDSGYNSYDDVYYAALSSSGVGTWNQAPAYPTALDSASCVSSGSTVYCVGGEEDSGQSVLNNVYYSQIPSPGSAPGSWSSATSYPQPTAAESCVVYNGYVYCVGGFDSNGDEVSASYYAALGSPGINSWMSTTAYPKAVDSESCVASGGYIYCVAGEVESGSNPNNPINNVYYAQLTSSGIGKWSAGPAYPASLAALSCVGYSGYVYCAGGFDTNQLSSTDAYYAPISSSGVGPWASAAPYPVAIDTVPCVVDSSFMYCIGGVSELSSGIATVNDANFAPLAGSDTSSTAPEFPASVAVPTILAAALGLAVTLGRRRGSPAIRA